MLALSQDCILIMYLHCFSLASLMYIDALMFMLMQCTYMTGKHLIFSPFCPWSCLSSFFVVVQSIANYFLVSLFCRFVMMTNKKSWAPDFRVERKFAKVTCRPLLCCQARWWRPGRVETSRRSGGWTSTSSASPPRALLVVRASLTPPSLSIWLLTFPEKDGVEHALLCEADLYDPFTDSGGCTGNVNQRLPPCAR